MIGWHECVVYRVFFRGADRGAVIARTVYQYMGDRRLAPA